MELFYCPAPCCERGRAASVVEFADVVAVDRLSRLQLSPSSSSSSSSSRPVTSTSSSIAIVVVVAVVVVNVVVHRNRRRRCRPSQSSPSLSSIALSPSTPPPEKGGEVAEKGGTPEMDVAGIDICVSVCSLLKKP
jgi:hypothetical protein